MSVPEELHAEVLEIKHQRDDLEAERDRLAQRVDELEAELEERPDVDAYQDLTDELREFIHRHIDVLDISGESTGRVEDLQRRVAELEAEKERLEAEVNPQIEQAVDILSADPVREVINDTAKESEYSDDHFWDTVTALADAGGAAQLAVPNASQRSPVAFGKNDIDVVGECCFYGRPAERCSFIQNDGRHFMWCDFLFDLFSVVVIFNFEHFIPDMQVRAECSDV
jgi:cell division protein FtsB